MKRLKVMAALLVILSLAYLCVACGNKTVEPAGEDGNSGTTQQDAATDDKTSAEDKTSPDNVTPTEGGVVTDGPLEITGGVVDSADADDDIPLVGPDDNKSDTKPNKPSGNTDTPDASQDLKWEEFYALAPEQKDAYLKSFGDYEKFYDWMVKAQAEFKTDHPDIEIGADGSIDLSKLK